MQTSLRPLVLGKDIITGQLVTLDQEQRLKGLYVIGKTGTGKSTLLVNMILQDIEAGRGLCFLDAAGDAITDILKRLPPYREKDVILLDPLDDYYAFGLNLFQCNNPQDQKEVSRVNSAIMSIFAKLFTESGDLFTEAPTMAETLQNVLPVLFAQQHPHMTMAEIPLLLMDETARLKLLEPLTEPLVKSFWNSYNRWKHEQQEKLIESTRRRVGNFLADPFILAIIGQSETTLNFTKIMDEGKILLIKLSREHELITSLVGSIIVAQIANAAFSRASQREHERVHFHLYADEYQRFSTPTFAELLAEVRKYKIATCVAHQWRSQLDEANRGATLNAANIVVFGVSGEDAEDLAKEFNATPPQSTVVERQEPKQAPVQDVLKHLVEKGHSNPIVGRFVSEFLKPAYEFSSSHAPYIPLGKERWLGYPDTWEIQRWTQKELPKLNTLFYDIMCRRIDLTQLILPVDMFITFSYLFDFYDVLGKKEMNPLTQTANLIQGLGSFFGGETSVKKELKDTEAIYLFFPSWSDIERGLMYLANQRKPPEQLERAKHFIELFRATTILLRDEPILVNTGQYIPVFEKRQYADVRNQIATELVNMPPYTARCKLGNKEYTIQILPLGNYDGDAIVQARHDRIITRTHVNYCKKRKDVKAEIAARQNALMKQEPRKPTTTKDEDEE